MTADTGELSYPCRDLYGLAEEFDPLGSVHKGSAKGISSLISDEKNGILLFPEVMLEVVLDTSGFAHTAGGYDDLGTGILIDSSRIIAADRSYEVVEAYRIYAAADEGKGFLVVAALTVAYEYIRSLIGEGTVHIYREAIVVLYKSLGFDMANKVEYLLSPADSK